MSWSVDGNVWEIPCEIERTAEVRASEISGAMLDGSYFNDVLGTYMRYDVSLAVPYRREDDYNALYEVLTDPVDGHTFVVPYGDAEITVTGRVENVRDVYLRLADGTLHWEGIKFSIVANHPSKYMSLGEVMARGRSPLPDEASVSIGQSYTYTASGWQELADADEVYY